jgi:hypothetical protein
LEEFAGWVSSSLPTNGWCWGWCCCSGCCSGAALAAGGGRKHKARYQDEARRATELERENDRLRKELKQAEIDNVSARARAPVDRT